MKTIFLNSKCINKKWYIIDANKKTLGRIISKISILLQGKNKPEYTPNIDSGDYVILLNILGINITGDKFNKKIYYKHSGYIGGLKSISYKDMFNKNPKYIIEHAIKGMLPKNKLGKIMIKKLKICLNSNHIYHAQKPKILDI